jgi:hypothetical protein
MARRRRSVEIFSLSFLDCICCGFGAVILFYTIISAQSSIDRTRNNDALTAEVNKIEEEVLIGTRNLVVLRNTLEKTESEAASASSRSTRLIQDLRKQRLEMAAYDATSLARRERIEKLKADIRSLEEGTRRLEGGAVDRAPPGQDIKAFRQTGGERRYITGIKMRGQRVLILLDRSASMLHQDLVNVILLRNRDETRQRSASKWRRALDTTNWIVTQLPAGSQFQIYAFNTKAEPALASSGGRWQSSDDPLVRSRNIEAVSALTPRDGTSLVNAFAAVKAMSTPPDQIILITDGLPTQGRSPGIRKFIDAGARVGLFVEALQEVPKNVPVDVVLLPMKGDLPAAHRFWDLARMTKGTLLMPSKDWP